MSSKYQHTQKYLQHKAQLFCQLQKKSEIFDLLKISTAQYKNLSENPQYQAFTIGKKSGGERHIENPNYALKKVQELLSTYLQAVYYFHKTPLAYGFVLNPAKEKDKRDILHNARRHLGKPYLLNLDLKDFFHTIEVPRLWKIFTQPPFRFQRETAEALTRLVSYRGRLPMGAPSSPVLSNFATRQLDADLGELTHNQRLTVSRYADDITFSSDSEITPTILAEIKTLITKNEFILNEAKIKTYQLEDTKEVTGILLLEGDKLGLPESFVPEVEKEIEQLKAILLVQNQQGKLNTQWVETFRKHLRGKINFLGYVLGNNSNEKKRLLELFNEANFPPPEDFGSYSWRTFHYQV